MGSFWKIVSKILGKLSESLEKSGPKFEKFFKKCR